MEAMKSFKEIIKNMSKEQLRTTKILRDGKVVQLKVKR